MSSVKDTSGNNKKNKRAYLNDFQKDETGAYIYRGTVYDYEGSESSLRSLKIRLSILGVLTLTMLLWAGLIQVPGMDHCFYVLLPYAAALCGSISVCWALVRLLPCGVSLRAYLFEESIEKLPGRCIFTACCSAAALLGEIVYILMTAVKIVDEGCIPYLIQQTICIVSMLLLRSGVVKARWRQNNETATDCEGN